MSQHTVVLLLGSNLGNRKENIAVATSRIEAAIGAVIYRSSLIQSEPVEFVSNNYFCNIALRIKTCLSPIYLLNAVKNIEVGMGRAKDSLITNEYADRVIDIDIVQYGNITFSSPRLQIPHHKHLHQREFSQKLLSEMLQETLKT